MTACVVDASVPVTEVAALLELLSAAIFCVGHIEGLTPGVEVQPLDAAIATALNATTFHLEVIRFLMV